MRAYVFILMAITGTMLMSCHDTTEGYLKTDSARYVPDTMEIRLQLDETLDAYRMHNMAPWVSPKLQGVIGTSPDMELRAAAVEEDGKTITNNLGTIATTNLENQSGVVHALGDQYFLGQLFELE